METKGVRYKIHINNNSVTQLTKNFVKDILFYRIRNRIQIRCIWIHNTALKGWSLSPVFRIRIQGLKITTLDLSMDFFKIKYYFLCYFQIES